jgi:hemolysin III
MTTLAHTRHHEEIANAITHGLGGLITLVAQSGTRTQLISAIVFCSTLVLLYTASTLYHAFPMSTAKQRLRVCDHCAIYVLIAGTYTPFTLIGLRGAIGWWLFGIVWALAAIGMTLKLFFTGKYELASTLAYVGMGWLAIFAIRPMLDRIPTPSLVWLLCGGIAYTSGVLFYRQKQLRYAHAVWHLFVLAGSACHFMAVIGQVVPA